MNRHAERGIIEANQEMQRVRTILVPARRAAQSLSPQEATDLLVNLHNAVSLLIGAVNVMNGGSVHGAATRF